MLTNIGGDLTVSWTSMMTSLHGLESLTNIAGNVVINGNDVLASVLEDKVCVF